MSGIYYTDSDTLDPRWCDLCKVKMRTRNHTDTVRHRTHLKEAEMEDKGYVRLKQTSLAVSFSSWLTKQGLITRTTTPNVAWIPYWVDGLFSASLWSMRTYGKAPEMAKLAVSYMLKDPDNLRAYLIWLDLAFSADDYPDGYFHESARRDAVLDYLHGVGLFDEPPEEPEGAE